jgi:leucyl/phenylalanyl-tRNA---protein transferase
LHPEGQAILEGQAGLEMKVSVTGQISPRLTVPAAAAPVLVRNEIMERRAALFQESTLEICQRVALGTAWALRPRRVGELWPLSRLWLSDLMAPKRGLPDLDVPAGAGDFAGMVHDLAAPTLVAAYRRGLFPKGHFGPLKWTSPLMRCVLNFDEYHMPKRLRRLMRQGKYRVTFDRDFEGVIKACAGKREGRWHVTWITPRIMWAYAALYDAGYVHSFEVWNEAGALVGGGYGVAVGGVFFTESQFSHEANTSKLGFSVLNWHLAKWGFELNDGKRSTPTILDMGFGLITRADFTRCLAAGVNVEGKPGRWEVEAGPETVANWNSGQRPNAATGAQA